MNRDSNIYTFGFAAVMVVIVASVLAFTSSSLKDLQNENIRNEKMKNILSTVGVDVSREDAQKYYDRIITQQLAVKSDGSVNSALNPFEDIDLVKEIKKEKNLQNFPLYVAEIDDEKFYIVELRGFGLWDAIWGYISFQSDFNTVKGVSFDHKGETAGLGAEITKDLSLIHIPSPRD